MMCGVSPRLLASLAVLALLATAPSVVSAWCAREVLVNNRQQPAGGRVANDQDSVGFKVQVQSRCMDGTQAIFYDSGHVSGQHCLAVFLNGGNMCHDAASCAKVLAEEPDKTTSAFSPFNITLSSVLHAGNAEFGCCRRVYVPYCSQDLFTGNGSATLEDGSQILFQGAAILQEVFAALNETTPGGLSTLSNALLGGFSAGSIGLSIHVNHLATLYWPANPEAVHFLADSGWLVSIPGTHLLDVTSLFHKISVAPDFWGSKGFVEERCPLRPFVNCYSQYVSSQVTNVSSLYVMSLQDLLYVEETAQLLQDEDSQVSAARLTTIVSYFTFISGAIINSVDEATGHLPIPAHGSPGKVTVVAAQCFQHGYFFPEWVVACFILRA